LPQNCHSPTALGRHCNKKTFQQPQNLPGQTKSHSLILVTHDMGFALDVGDRTVFMHQGKIWESGSSWQIFSPPQTPELQNFIAAVL